MTPYKDCSSIYKPVDNRVVYMGNNQAGKVASIGNVTITMADGMYMLLRRT